MAEYIPQVIENRDFVGLEEEDIQKLNRIEARKFRDNPEINRILNEVEAELGKPGRWEEHWLTVDASGKRVYARIYYSGDRGAAVTADGRIIKKFDYSQPKS